MTNSYVLQLGQSSGQAKSVGGPSDAAMFHDYLVDLGHGDDVVGFTETHQRLHVLRAACDQSHYVLHYVQHSDVALAVSRRHKVLGAGARPGLPAAHNHTGRPILWLTFQPVRTRERVTVHEAHWVREDQPGHVELTDVMADAVKLGGHGTRLSFWMGDVNNLDGPRDRTAVDRALAAGELVSCWDELGRYPDTHPGGPDAPIDVVGKWDPDTRVHCLKARRWPRQHTDHVSLSAWYSFSPVKGL